MIRVKGLRDRRRAEATQLNRGVEPSGADIADLLRWRVDAHAAAAPLIIARRAIYNGRAGAAGAQKKVRRNAVYSIDTALRDE